MSTFLFCSKFQFLYIYKDTEVQEPLVTISSPDQINEWFVNYDKSILWILCDNGYLYKIDEFNQKLAASSNQPAISLEKDKDNCIFNQLLEDQSSDPFSVVNHAENVYKVTNKDKILLDIVVTSLTGFQDLIILATKNGSSYNIHVYNVKNLLPQNSRPELIIKCPEREPSKHRSTGVHKLFVVTSSKFSTSKTQQSCLLLPQSLFECLFNKESDLLNSPVILYSDQGGCIYYSYLKQNLMKLPKAIETLCEIGSDVVNICFIKVIHCETNSTEHKSACLYDVDPLTELPALLVISSSGKVLLFFKVKSRRCWFSTVIFGPVVCCTIEDDVNLFHSTGQCIYKDKFYYIESDKRVEVESSLLHDVKVQNMKLVKEESGSSLICWSMKNTVISLPCVLGNSPFVATSLKDILLGIDYQRHKYDKILKLQKDLNSVIQQINVGANVLQNTFIRKRLIDCEIKIDSVLEGIIQEFRLCLQITNQSQLKLSSDWSVVLYLYSNSQSASKSHSINLKNGLNPNQKFCINVPVTFDIAMVDVRLILSLSNNVISGKPSDSDPSRINSRPSCYDLCVPLYSCELNVLDFLLNEEDFCDNSAAVPSAPSYLAPSYLNDTKKITKIYTAKLQTSSEQFQSLLPENYDVQSGPISPELMFSCILKSNKKTSIKLENGICRLRHLDGHMVSISLHSSKSGGTSKEPQEDIVINLNSNYCPLLASTRAAILNNIKASQPRSLKSVTSLDRHQYVKHLEDVKSDLEELKLSLSQNTDEENQVSMFNIYEKLRQTLL